MQIRPQQPLELVPAPIDLPDSFPLVGGKGYHRQSDTPITYLHVHNCFEIGYCHSGQGVFVVEEKIMPYGAGDINVINEREMHLAQSETGTESVWTFVNLDPARLVGGGATEEELLNTSVLGGPWFENIMRPSDRPGICAIVKDIVDELREERAGFRSAVRALVWRLMVELHRLVPTARMDAAVRPREAVERVAPALQYCARNYSRPMSISELADLCALSPTHLRRLFRQATGRSPLEYLTNLRMRMACSLLSSTSRSIQEVCLAVGYASPSSFNRHFRKCIGMAPREWRGSGG